MTPNQHKLFWRSVLLMSIVFTIASMFQMLGVAQTYQIDILHSIWIFLLAVMAGVVIAAVILFILQFTNWQNRLLALPEKVSTLSKKWQILAIGVLLLLFPVYSVITLNPYLGRFYAHGQWTHLALFWWLSLLGMVCLKVIKKDLEWFAALWLDALVSAVFIIIIRQFLTVTNYPFALTWSEAARFYGASLLFSRQIYGEQIPLGVMHPTWHFLLSIPYLFGKLPIWVHRLWWALLQLILGMAVSWVLAKRLKVGNRGLVWVFAGWVLIFLFPRPLLVHLLFCTLIVLWGVRTEKFWRTTLVVILASIWAGLSRINWFPVPGLFVAVLYFVEIPYNKPNKAPEYLWKPLFWILGGSAVAIASNLVYISATGNGTGGNFSSSVHSALLWYRLLPNPTYPQGILPDLLLLTGPVILALIMSVRSWKMAIHPLRQLGIFGSLMVLLGGGLVVSVKIGGGSDLHNLDAFLILLMIVAGYFLFGNYSPDTRVEKPSVLRNAWVLSLLLLTPVWMIIRVNTNVFVWNKASTDKTLNLIRLTVGDISGKGGEVLFISQRQLLALQMVNTSLVPDYEQDFLMEMVMSHNQAYLDRFQQDLRAQRFGAIVLDAQNEHFYGKSRAFGEENDLWVEEVTIPLLCYYEVPPAFTDLPIVVYTPRSTPCK